MSKSITYKDLFNGVVLPLEIVMKGNYDAYAQANFQKIKDAVAPLLIHEDQNAPVETGKLIEAIEAQGYKSNTFPFSYLKSYCSQIFDAANIPVKTQAKVHLEHIADTIREYENQQSSGASVRTLSAS